jgi:hypothetical protein
MELGTIQCIVDCQDFSEEIKIEIAHAMAKGEIFTNS